MSSNAQQVNIGASFSGQAEFKTFQQTMRDNIATADAFALSIGSVNLQGAIFGNVIKSMGAALLSNNKAMVDIKTSTFNLSTAMTDLLKNLKEVNLAHANMMNITNSNGASIMSNNTIFMKGSAAANRYGISLQGIAKIAFVQVISRYTQAIANAFDEGIKSAAEFDIKIAAIRTISQETAITQDQWRMVIRDLSDEFGNPLLDAAAGTYEAISNQVAKGTGAIRFMNEAMSFGKTTMASTADAVNLLSSVINAYGKSSEEANAISATLFKTIELGRVTTTEIANILGPATVSANLLGVEFEDVGASLAILTSQGTHANTSLTLISNIIQKMAKPTEKMKELFAEWKVSSGEAAIATYGFAGVIEKLGEVVARGGLTEIAETFRDIRPTRGIAGLTGGNMLGDYRSVLDQIKSSQESYQKAQAIVAESAGAVFKKEVNKIQNLLTVDLSNSVLMFLVKLTGGIEASYTMIRSFIDGLYAISEALAVFIGAGAQAIALLDKTNLSVSTLIITFAGAQTALLALRLTASTLPVVGQIIALASAATTVYAILADSERKRVRDGEAAIKEMNEAYEVFHKERIKEIQEKIKVEKEAMDATLQTGHQAIAAIQSAWDDATTAMIGKAKSFEDYVKTLDKFLEKLKAETEKGPITSLINEFDNTLKGGTTVAALIQIMDVVEQLGDVTRNAMNEGNFEMAERGFDAYKDKLKSVQDEVEKMIRDSTKRQEDAVTEFQNRKFDLTVGKMGPKQAKQAIEEEIARLKQEAIDYANIFESEKARDSMKRAEELARRATELNQSGKVKGKLDFTLEEDVLNANVALEKMIHLQGNGIKPLQTELETRQQITEELQKQKELLDNQAKAKEAKDLVQQEFINASKMLDNLDAQKQQSQQERSNLITSMQTASGTAMIAHGGAESFLENLDPTGQSALVQTQEKMRGALKDLADEMTLAAEALKRGVKPEDVRKRLAIAADDFNRFNSENAFVDQNLVKSLKHQATDMIRQIDVFSKVDGKRQAAEAVRPALVESIKRVTQLLVGNATEVASDELKRIQAAAAGGGAETSAVNKLNDAFSALVQYAGQSGMPIRRPPGFAQGGILQGPAGYDNLTFKGMAGEGFLSREMTARYYPQFKAMVDGTHPVSNSNVYNMSFNVQGGDTSEQTVRSIGTLLRREIVRGRIPGLGG